VHDVCAPIALTVSAPTGAQRAGIDGALTLWRDHGVGTLSVIDGVAAGPDGPDAIELRFQEAALPFHGLYDDETGVVFINRAIEDQTPLSIVIAHELGHAFGLPHVPFAERPSLMNPGNFVTPPTDDDRAAIEALWGRCGDPAP
jgi:Matrixin